MNIAGVAATMTLSIMTGCGQATGQANAVQPCADPVAGCVLSTGTSLQTQTTPAVLTPIEVKLRDVPVTVTSVRLEAYMPGMSMPPVGTDLRSSGPSEWSGRLILPVCSEGRSDWHWVTVTRVGTGEQRSSLLVHATRD